MRLFKSGAVFVPRRMCMEHTATTYFQSTSCIAWHAPLLSVFPHCCPSDVVEPSRVSVTCTGQTMTPPAPPLAVWAPLLARLVQASHQRCRLSTRSYSRSLKMQCSSSSWLSACIRYGSGSFTTCTKIMMSTTSLNLYHVLPHDSRSRLLVRRHWQSAAVCMDGMGGAEEQVSRVKNVS